MVVVHYFEPIATDPTLAKFDFAFTAMRFSHMVIVNRNWILLSKTPEFPFG